MLFVEERGQIRPATAEERATVARASEGRGGSVTGERWHDVCALEDLVEGTGVCALVGGRQIAVFQVHGRVYALDNFDPASRANVLSRGLTGDLQGERVVASPIYKHHFALTSGRCIEDPTFSVTAYPTRVVDGRVQVEVPRAARRMRLVVAGNGMAGMRTVEELLKLGVADRFSITVFGAEPRGNYNRILLSPVLSGEAQADDIMLHRPGWYTKRGITLHAGDPIVEIDRKRRMVRSRNGVVAPYDRLLIATGSDPIMLPLPGKDLPGVVTFRDLDDVNRMLEASGNGRRAVVIGGGLLGLEAAHGLSLRGMHVTVVHLLDTLMERQLDAPAGALLKAALEKRGIEFRMRAKTQAILGTRACHRRALRRAARRSPPISWSWPWACGPTSSSRSAAHLACDRGILVDDMPADLRPGHLRGGRVRAASPPDLRPGGAAVGTGAHLRAAHRRDRRVALLGSAQCHAAQGVGHRSVLGRRFFRESRRASRWCSPTSAAASTSAWCSRATGSAARCCSATRAKRRDSRS